MATAVEIITDSMEWLNKLSPGETLNADDTAKCFSRLNTIVDKWSAKKAFLYKSIVTSATQTGNITLAAGSYASIPLGSNIITVNVEGREISKLTMQQYAALYDATQGGTPTTWAYDGFTNVYLYPVPTTKAVELLTQTGVAAFADTTTNYTMPPGYKAALGIALAVSMAPILNPGMLVALLREQKSAMAGIEGIVPEILDTYSYGRAGRAGSILNGW